MNIFAMMELSIKVQEALEAKDRRQGLQICGCGCAQILVHLYATLVARGKSDIREMEFGPAKIPRLCSQVEN